MAKDIRIRNATLAVVLVCGIYCAFGVAAGVAADQPGTAIRHDEPISFSMLWQEISRLSLEAVVAWLPRYGGFWFLFYSSIPLLLAAAALTLAVNPRIFCRAPGAVFLAGVGFGIVSALLFGGFGFLGPFHFLFTLLNAFAWRGLDGEWVIEFSPVFDTIGILYLAVFLLFGRSLSFVRPPRILENRKPA